MTYTISQMAAADKEQWEPLYKAYATFYKMPMEQSTLDTVWSWIQDDANPFFGIIAKNEAGEAVGMAHCREMPSPLRGAVLGFLDDLYVTPECRGTGCVQEIYGELKSLGKERGWPCIRWITAEDNYRARTSYDRVADKTIWQTYQMAVE
jgi:ribosomal protein S18 acetylase RimI-like enzyme